MNTLRSRLEQDPESIDPEGKEIFQIDDEGKVIKNSDEE